MDKKDIYEHLAKIYLDASLNKPKKKKEYPQSKLIFFFAMAVILSSSLFILPRLARKDNPNVEVALILHPDIAKINFNFDPARKEIFSVNLNRLNLAKYKTVAFAAKNINYSNPTSLKVEFSNIFKEKSEVYIRDIPRNWHDYKVDFADFRNITDWSEMENISFIIEQWNAKEKHGVVLVENIRFLK